MLQARFLFSALLLLLAKSTVARYRTIKHPHNSSYAIRVKEHADGVLCNGGGKHFTGWADVGDRHLFYCSYPAPQSFEHLAESQ
jgi:cathepsin A (carboxypeptidase C)